ARQGGGGVGGGGVRYPGEPITGRLLFRIALSRNVRFGPKADIDHLHSMTSSAAKRKPFGIVTSVVGASAGSITATSSWAASLPRCPLFPKSSHLQSKSEFPG